MAADAARRSAADIARTVDDAAEALVRGARLLGAPDDAVRAAVERALTTPSRAGRSARPEVG